jgi:hypothetical protein
MAVGTLTFIMVGWDLLLVAADTVFSPDMVKGNQLPVLNDVTSRAGSLIVV